MMLVVLISIILLGAALILLFHHGWAHSYDPPNSHARTESCVPVCYFQLSDIANHETWIMVCLTNALTFAVLAPAVHNITVW